MKIREATPDDRQAVRRVAQQSLAATYPLETDTIEAAITDWYNPETFQRIINEDDRLILVAEHRPPTGEHIIGFVELVFTNATVADINWLHVAPEYRDLGIGRTLYEQARNEIQDEEITQLRGHVLAENTPGNEFYADQGLEKTTTQQVDIGDETFTENVYVEIKESLRLLTTADGDELYIDPESAETGSTGSFYTVYTDPGKDVKWGYFCSACDSVVTTMDTMERMVCSTCGNTRKPTRWDAAYL